MEEEKKEETGVEKTESNAKAIFIARLSAFVIFSTILPACFVMWRYGIFTNGEVKLNLAGWGLICSIIVFVVARYVMGQLKAVMPWSLFSQVVTGFMNVILPLLLVYFALTSMRDSMDLLIQCVLAIALSEAVAIVVNPFPQWRHDHNVEVESKTFKERAEQFAEIWSKKNKKGE